MSYKKKKVLVEEEVLCCDGCGDEITWSKNGAPLRFPSVSWPHGGPTLYDLCPKCYDMVLLTTRDLLDQIRDESTTKSESDPT